MFRIAIVEDQDETRECLNRFVRQYAEEQGVQVEISLITDGSEIAEHYTPGFDIIFMDVEMPRLDGFGAAEAIRAVDAEVVLVFVTNMAQYAIRGYEVDALDYVLKPVNYYQFCTKLSRAIQRVQRRRGGQVVLQLAGGGIPLDRLYPEIRRQLPSAAQRGTGGAVPLPPLCLLSPPRTGGGHRGLPAAGHGGYLLFGDPQPDAVLPHRQRRICGARQPAKR